MKIFSFSLSSLVMVVLVSCAVLLQDVNSFIIPFTQVVSKTWGTPKASVARNENQLDQSLHGPRMGSREKRWAIPADVQDIPCKMGNIRREDGKCYTRDKDDDYG